ncbi:RNA 3'-terminal phosphate cyclase [Bacteroidota bacterium]
MKKIVEIDGSFGEGGGQILRSSLSLSMFLEQPFRIKNIRAGREKPGLMRQHLTAVNAAAEICGAELNGAEISSLKLEFYPGKVKTGDYKFDIGTAGSTTLVLQTLLPVLILGEGESNIILGGGTHNQYSPPLDFLEKSFFIQIRKMGPEISVKVKAFGFFPIGGGKFSVNIKPVNKLRTIEILSRGKNISKKAYSYSSGIDENIGQKEMRIVKEKLGWPNENCISQVVDSPGPGNAVLLIDENENSTEVFTGFGRKHYPLKKVTIDSIKEYTDYINCDVPVYKYLADQLIIPMALAGKGSFITSEPSLHTLTNIEVVKKFLDIDVKINELNEKQCKISIGDGV